MSDDVYMYIYIYTYIHTYIHTYTYIHVGHLQRRRAGQAPTLMVHLEPRCRSTLPCITRESYVFQSECLKK